MKKLVVFEDLEWEQFKRKLAIEMSEVSRQYEVTDRETGESINKDGRSGVWWMGTVMLAIDCALGKVVK